MTNNDTTTLNGALQELGETLAENLVAMGVTDATASDGLTTLASKVLDITPSLTGVSLTTGLSCDSSLDIVDIGETTNIIGVLTASYDDTSQSNVDLNGFLQGASIKVYEGNTLIDTVITNNRGEYTSQYSPSQTGNVIIHTTFDGTEDYDSCTSNNKIITVEDLLKYGFSNVTPFVAFSGRNTTYTSLNDNQLTQTSGNKGGCHSNTAIFETEADYTITFKIVESTLTESNGVRIGIHSANYTDHHERACLGIGYTGDSTTNTVSFDYSNSDVTSVTKESTNLTSLNVGDVIKFIIIDDTFSAYINDTLYTSATLDWLHDPVWLYCQSWGTGTASMTITDFKVQQAKDSITLTSDKDIISAYDNGTAILTATYKEEGIRTANKSIIFKNGDTVLDTVTTDNNGEAEYTYTATGDGDVTITANYSNLNSNILIEDCIYYVPTEWSLTTGSSMSKGFVFNDEITDLPQHFLLSCDMKVSSNSGSEDRLFLTPNTSFSGEQPSSGFAWQISSSGVSTTVCKVNGSNQAFDNKTVSVNTYATFAFERNGSDVSSSINGESIGSKTGQTWIDDYNAWKFSYSLWKRPNITCYAKNFKIKKL